MMSTAFSSAYSSFYPFDSTNSDWMAGKLIFEYLANLNCRYQ